MTNVTGANKPSIASMTIGFRLLFARDVASTNQVRPMIAALPQPTQSGGWTDEKQEKWREKKFQKNPKKR